MKGDRPLALVTGGARRVGRAICLELARAGCDIALTFSTSGDAARGVVDEVVALGREARAARLELDDAATLRERAASIIERLPRLDVVVQNASVYGPTPLNEATAEGALHQFRVNALAPLLLTAACAERLGASELPGGGAVVAMADMHAMGRPRIGYAPYSMSKAALVEMVRSLARELAPRIRVNAVAPGVVAFPETGAESDRDAQEMYVRRVPLRRAGTLEDAARTVRWLALEATYVTGEVIRLDGGRWLA